MKAEFIKRISGLLLAVIMVMVSVTAAFALDPKGRPRGMGPNAPGGYYIWQDERGWHLRTTTGGAKHRFTGEIISEGGSITEVKQYRDEPANWFKQQGSKLTLDLSADKNIDGIDFQANGSLTFRLSIDDVEDATIVRVGANGESPSGIPFTLSAR
jgi:hypothetical protein